MTIDENLGKEKSQWQLYAITGAIVVFFVCILGGVTALFDKNLTRAISFLTPVGILLILFRKRPVTLIAGALLCLGLLTLEAFVFKGRLDSLLISLSAFACLFFIVKWWNRRAHNTRDKREGPESGGMLA